MFCRTTCASRTRLSYLAGKNGPPKRSRGATANSAASQKEATTKRAARGAERDTRELDGLIVDVEINKFPCAV